MTLDYREKYLRSDISNMKSGPFEGNDLILKRLHLFNNLMDADDEMTKDMEFYSASSGDKILVLFDYTNFTLISDEEKLSLMKAVSQIVSNQDSSIQSQLYLAMLSSSRINAIMTPIDTSIGASLNREALLMFYGSAEL